MGLLLILRSASRECIRDSGVVGGACCAQLATIRRCFIFPPPFPFPPASDYPKPPLSTSSPPSHAHFTRRITVAAPLQQYLDSLYGTRRLMHRRRGAFETDKQQGGFRQGKDAWEADCKTQHYRIALPIRHHHAIAANFRIPTLSPC